MPSAIAVEKTENKKTGPVSVTMASQASCPKSCPFMGNGCYAESGPQGIHTSRLNRDSTTDPDNIAFDEVMAIKKLSGTRPLRLHIVGDCTTEHGATLLSNATRRFKHTWTYTHSFRTIARKFWGKISVLASCETFEDVRLAWAKGYSAAIVLPEFQSDKAYMVEGIKVIPCPEQTGKTANCTTCRLCWDDDKLKTLGAVIGFSAHGSRSKTLLKVLG